MERERDIGLLEKARMYVDKHKPGKSRHSLTDVTYDLEDLSPFAVDFSGAPKNKVLLLIMALLTGYLVYWFWYGWVNTGPIDYALLEYMSLIALVCGFMLAVLLVSSIIDLHKGSFNPYSKIIEMRVRSLLGKPLKRVEFKVLRDWELYNPTVGGYWRSAEEYLEEADEESKLKKDFKPVDMETEGMPFYELEGNRFSSMKDMSMIMKMALVEGEVVETKDEIKDILELKRRFAELSEKIKLPFVVTMCKCDSKGGRVYPIFISQYSLFGGSTGLSKSYVEFRNHTLAQRTWAGIVSKDNVRAGVGEGIEIGMYKFYDLVPDKLALTGKREEGMKFAPIIFVSASDAQAEKMMNDFGSNETRESPVQQDLIDASVIYNNSIADDLFETLKLVISRLKRKEKSEDDIRKDSVYDNKSMVYQGLEMALITQKAGKPSRFSNINLFSHKSIKYLFYIIAVVGAIFLAFYILHYYVGMDFGWLFNEVPSEEPDDDWTDIARIGWEWFK